MGENLPTGICRAVGVGIKWLMHFMVARFDALPDHLNVESIACTSDLMIQRLDVEDFKSDELCSFVGKKANKQWIWIAMDVKTRQIIAFHVRDRSRKNPKQLWKNITEVYR